MQKIDYIIVGGGISGVFLSKYLNENNHSYRLFNSNEKISATQVAPGTWNPMAFKNYELSWRFEELYKKLIFQINDLEKILGQTFFQSLSIYKLLQSKNDIDFWKLRANTKEMKSFMNTQLQKADYPEEAFWGEIHKGGRINLPLLLTSYWQQLETDQKLIKQEFDYTQLHFKDDFWIYQDIQCKGVIFCEGAYVSYNPYFSWIPLKPAAGDVLTIKAPDLHFKGIFKKNIFILPLVDDLYQVGATYNWDVLTWENHPEARIELEEKLQQMIRVPYQVVNQQAGVRPTSFDRRPIVGEHPEKKGLFVFNGLGTKGVLLAPQIAFEFIDYLINNSPLDPVINLNRCEKFYPN